MLIHKYKYRMPVVVGGPYLLTETRCGIMVHDWDTKKSWKYVTCKNCLRLKKCENS